jgi:hypothetical protein
MGFFARGALWKTLWKMWKTSVDIILLSIQKIGIMSTFVLSSGEKREWGIILQKILPFFGEIIYNSEKRTRRKPHA